VSDVGFIPLLLMLISVPNVLNNIDENKEQVYNAVLRILYNIAKHPETKVIFHENNGTLVSKIRASLFFVLIFLLIKIILNNERKSKSSPKLKTSI
jgi:hypothetical protein